jgi:hypothetical protein
MRALLTLLLLVACRDGGDTRPGESEPPVREMSLTVLSCTEEPEQDWRRLSVGLILFFSGLTIPGLFFTRAREDGVAGI